MIPRRPLATCIDCGESTGHPSRLERCYPCSLVRAKAVDAARNVANKAIRNGTLVRFPCERCGHPNSEAHHTDYSKPLDVVWLCKTHHEIEHVALRRRRAV